MAGEEEEGVYDESPCDALVREGYTIESSAPAPGTLYSAIKECTPKRRTDGSENLIRI